MLSGRVTDKMLFVTIYTLVAMLVVIQGGRQVTNYVLDVMFYNNYLMPWQVQLIVMRQQTTQWPVYREHDPAGYMRALVDAMALKGLAAPESNTDKHYVYKLNKFGEKEQQILIVGTLEKIILFNLPESTFNRIDWFIDSHLDATTGRFTGKVSTDGISRIGYLKI